MDKEWDDYYDDLDEWKERTGFDDPEEAEAAEAEAAKHREVSSMFSGGTLGVDLGTTSIKVSHLPQPQLDAKKKPMAAPKPAVCVDREGHRSTPSWVLFENEEAASTTLAGRLALERRYDRRGGIAVNPREGLTTLDADGRAGRATGEAVRTAASNALEQALGGGGTGKGREGVPLFVIDPSASTGASYNVRPVFTYQPPPTHANGEGGDGEYLPSYRRAVCDLCSPEQIAAFVPDPVAAVVGAEHLALLPSSSPGPVLVVDVGGTSTAISVVSSGTMKKEVLYASPLLPVGGETLVDALVSNLIEGFFGPTSSDALDDDDVESNDLERRLEDPAALQRIHDAARESVLELSKKTRSQISIPYLTVDSQMKPRHLEVGVSRTVLEAEMNARLRDLILPRLTTKDDGAMGVEAEALSPSMPPPTNAKSLFASATAKALEATSLSPYALRAVLVVGGGVRSPVFRDAVREALAGLAGEAFAASVSGGGRLVVPEGELAEELVVLGAAAYANGIR